MGTIFSENKWVFEEAPCLVDSPYKEAARKFIVEALKFGRGQSQMMLRCLVSISLFNEKVKIEESKNNPVELFIKSLDRHKKMISSANTALNKMPSTVGDMNHFNDVIKSTGEHFGALFSGFDDKTYFKDGLKVVSDRLKKNDYPLKYLQGKKALDAGCGGGRYSVALSKIGLGDVTGIDMSDIGLRDANKRVDKHKIRNVKFKKDNVLKLSFKNESFDFVWSSGVLHHTTDMQKGMNELMRVLKKGGCGYLYLIENPGGIFWDSIELLRILLKDISFDFARNVYAMAGVSPYDTFYILDHAMVPINIRSTPKEVETLLKNSGAKNIKRLKRGTDFDRVEKIFRKEPFAEIKYGVGENRYYFEK